LFSEIRASKRKETGAWVQLASATGGLMPKLEVRYKYPGKPISHVVTNMFCNSSVYFFIFDKADETTKGVWF
jgi:hypothetical protein